MQMSIPSSKRSRPRIPLAAVEVEVADTIELARHCGMGESGFAPRAAVFMRVLQAVEVVLASGVGAGVGIPGTPVLVGVTKAL